MANITLKNSVFIGEMTQNSRLRKFVWIAGICLVAAVVLYLYFYQHQIQSKLAHNADEANTQQRESQLYTQLQYASNTKSAKGQYSSAADAWVSYAQKTTVKAYKVKALQNAGLLYATSGNYQKSLGILQEAESSNGITYTLSTAIAATAMRAGNKAVAIKYLQESLKLMPKTMHDTASQKKLVNEEINQLNQE